MQQTEKKNANNFLLLYQAETAFAHLVGKRLSFCDGQR
jgi:hypothetical protein